MVFFALHSHFEQLSVCVYSVRQNYKTQQCSITSQMISIAHVYMFFAKFLEWQDEPHGMQLSFCHAPLDAVFGLHL